jgi:hypothetical protein
MKKESNVKKWITAQLAGVKLITMLKLFSCLYLCLPILIIAQTFEIKDISATFLGYPNGGLWFFFVVLILISLYDVSPNFAIVFSFVIFLEVTFFLVTWSPDGVGPKLLWTSLEGFFKVLRVREKIEVKKPIEIDWTFVNFVVNYVFKMADYIDRFYLWYNSEKKKKDENKKEGDRWRFK